MSDSEVCNQVLIQTVWQVKGLIVHVPLVLLWFDSIQSINFYLQSAESQAKASESCLHT